MLKEDAKYVNGSVVEFAVDPDKLCYWDMLGDLKELGYDIQRCFNLFFVDDGRTLKSITNDEGIVSLCDKLRRHGTVDIFVESLDISHEDTLPDVLLPNSQGVVELEMGEDDDDRSSSALGEDDEGQDDEERLVSVPFINYSSDEDEERNQARDKVAKYIQLKKTIQKDVCERNNEDGDACRLGNVSESSARNNMASTIESGKVIGYESDYIDSSDPGSYEETSGNSDADDAIRHRSSNKHYDPNAPLAEFFLDLRFVDLKQFKIELVEFLTRKGFELKYIKNDVKRVRARCSAKGCKWLILYSWSNGKKLYVVKNYVTQHSCLLKATKNKRVTSNVIARRLIW